MGVLGKMVQKKKEGVELNEDSYSSLCKEMHSAADLDLEEVRTCDPGSLSNLLKKDKGFNEKNIELLADLLKTAGDIASPDLQYSFYQKAIEIHRFLDSEGKTFSMERMLKINELDHLLKKK